MKTILILLSVSCILLFSSCNSEKKIVSAKEEWYALLPECPCRNPDFDSIRPQDGWARELHKKDMGFLKRLLIGKKDFTFFHPGATATFRSYPPVYTIINGKKFRSGQQCAYDKQGKLMVTGPAAGTPDKISPARKEGKEGELKVCLFRVIGHQMYDSGPWDESQWQVYHTYWPPNIGKGCKNESTGSRVKE